VATCQSLDQMGGAGTMGPGAPPPPDFLFQSKEELTPYFLAATFQSQMFQKMVGDRIDGATPVIFLL
jgi:hypothetical protein